MSRLDFVAVKLVKSARDTFTFKFGQRVSVLRTRSVVQKDLTANCEMCESENEPFEIVLFIVLFQQRSIVNSK